MKRWFIDLCKAFRLEMHTITHDVGVLLFFVALPLAYPVVYTVIYNPEQVNNLPFAVVDHARTPESRHLVRMADATPEMTLYNYAADMQEARRLMAEGEVYGIMEIPADYSRCIGTGRQAHVTFFSEMSLLLRYRAFLSALTEVQLQVGQEITQHRLNTIGLPATAISTSPLEVDTNYLGDTQQGFASFIIPGIVILILQQSMVLGICLIAGTRRDQRLNPDFESGASASLWGKALAYTFFYIPCTIYILHYIPTWFNLPHIGSPTDYMLFILPFLLASAMFGLMCARLMRQREDAFIYVVFTSVVFLFLSGLTWPRFAMSGLWHSLGDCIPATWGVEGFIRINSNGATLGEESSPYLWLWGLTAAYFLTAWLVERLYRFSLKNPRK